MNATSSSPKDTHYETSFYAIVTRTWLNFATPPVPVTKCRPSRRGRKTLRFDYKPPRISFSQLSELGRDRITFQWEQKRGSESEEARKEQEAIERAAGNISLAPTLKTAPKECSICGNSIPGEAKRFQILSVEQPSVGISVTAIELLKVQCEKCHDVGPVSSQSESGAEDESWMEVLSPNEREAHRLREQGLNQDQISKRMGKHQTTVGRWLKNIEVKQQSARSQKYQTTGGA